MCLKKACFPDCWKFLSVVLVFKNVAQRSRAKSNHIVSILSVVSKVFEKLVNNILLITSRNVTFCLVSSTVSYLLDQLLIFLTVLSDTIARAFNRSVATPVVALHIFEAFDRN